MTLPSPAPRLVATDLDGTALRSDGTFSGRTVDALARVERAGADLIFVTGRPVRWMRSVAAATGHHGHAICGNGAVVYDLHEERVLRSWPIAAHVLADVVRRLRAALPGLSFAVEREDGFVREEAYRHHEPVGIVSPSLPSTPGLKLLAQDLEIDPDTLLDKARQVVGATVELTHSSGKGLLEVSAAGVSKASTLAILCAERGIEASHVVSFGDMPNDLPLLAWAGTSYAVASAHPAVLAAVDHHTAGNDEEGVAQVLERLFPE